MMILFYNFMFQVSFRKGDTILLYAQVISAADKWNEKKIRKSAFGLTSTIILVLKDI